MNRTLVCSEVRPADGNHKACIVVAHQDDQSRERTIDITDALKIEEARTRLQSDGIALGGSLQPSLRATPRSHRWPSAVQIAAYDENGTRHFLIGDVLEEWSLSSGSTSWYLTIPELPAVCRWLVGRTLTLTLPSPANDTNPDNIELSKLES